MNDIDKEVLLITQEECAEVTQAISKVLRFGIDNAKPGTEYTNRKHLEEEVGDLMCMISLLMARNIISEEGMNVALQNKMKKLQQWSGIFS